MRVVDRMLSCQFEMITILKLPLRRFPSRHARRHPLQKQRDCDCFVPIHIPDKQHSVQPHLHRTQEVVLQCWRVDELVHDQAHIPSIVWQSVCHCRRDSRQSLRPSHRVVTADHNRSISILEY
jgi:hypothetical protein